MDGRRLPTGKFSVKPHGYTRAEVFDRPFFKKVAVPKGGAFGRRPQVAKHPYRHKRPKGGIGEAKRGNHKWGFPCLLLY